MEGGVQGQQWKEEKFSGCRWQKKKKKNGENKIYIFA